MPRRPFRTDSWYFALASSEMTEATLNREAAAMIVADMLSPTSGLRAAYLDHSASFMNRIKGKASKIAATMKGRGKEFDVIAERLNTYFKITSDSPYDLLVKAISSSSDSSVVTVAFNVTDIDTIGVAVGSTSPLYITRTVCVNGAADLGVYTASTGFTRESPPPAP